MGRSVNVTDDDSPGTVTALTNAKTAGFPTFVVGIGNTMGDATLNMLAVAGGESQVRSAGGNSFYAVNSRADLETALTKIVGMVASCGELVAAYACADDLICADADGNTVRAEPVSSSRNPCHICAQPAD